MNELKAVLQKKIDNKIYEIMFKTKVDNIFLLDNKTTLDKELERINNGIIVDVDDTLTKSQSAADAKVTGDILNNVINSITNIQNKFTQSKNLFNKSNCLFNYYINENGDLTRIPIYEYIVSDSIPLINGENIITSLNILIPGSSELLNAVYGYSSNVQDSTSFTSSQPMSIIKNDEKINNKIYTLYKITITDNTKYIRLAFNLEGEDTQDILDNVLVCESSEYDSVYYPYNSIYIKDEYINRKNNDNITFVNGHISINDTSGENKISISDIDGIKILNNSYESPRSSSNYDILIGTTEASNSNGLSSNDLINGISFSKKEIHGSFKVLNGGNDIISLSTNEDHKDVIKGNSSLSITTPSGSISFDANSAGIRYPDSTWTENLSQLEINAAKGVVIQSNNNSYFQSGDKKLVLGNNFNQLEFKTDGIAKFKKTIDAPDYQINGISLTTKITDIAEDVIERTSPTKYILNEQIGSVQDDDYDWRLLGTNNDNSFYELDLHLKPNIEYKFDNTDSLTNNTNHISTIKMDFSEKYFQTDIFKVNIELSSFYKDDNINITNIESKIILPPGVSWQNNNPPYLLQSDMENELSYNYISIIIQNNTAIYEFLDGKYLPFNSYFPEYNFSITDLNPDGELYQDDLLLISKETTSTTNNNNYDISVIYGDKCKFSMDFKSENPDVIKFMSFSNNSFVELKNVKIEDTTSNAIQLPDDMNFENKTTPGNVGTYNIYACGTTIYWELLN